jgi:hypothetical protein
MVLAFFGPRLAILVMWLTTQGRIMMNLAFQGWLLPLLGFIFLPWTTLMYAIVYGANGIVGFDWVWLVLAVALDVATYTGNAAKRSRCRPPSGAPERRP